MEGVIKLTHVSLVTISGKGSAANDAGLRDPRMGGE